MEQSIYDNTDSDKSFLKLINNFFSNFNFSSLLKECHFRKTDGFSCLAVLKNIFLLIFTGKNWYRTFSASNQKQSYGKDVVYRFLNSVKWHWENLILSLCQNIITWLTSLTDDSRPKVLIADDTFYNRTRSKKVEFLSWVYDHVDGKSKKGFTKLTLGWSDGFTFLPLQFRLVSSKNHKNINYKSEYVDKKYAGHTRRVDVRKKKTDLLFEMVKLTIAKSIQYSQLLFDSWFAFPSIITQFKQIGVKIVTMLKKSPKIFYEFRGKEYALTKIYALTKYRMDRKTNRYSIIVWLNNYDAGIRTQAKILFIKEKRKWLALLTTDIDLKDDEIIKTYGLRWNIEVFFKMCKSYLNLAKEFQGRSFDMLVAHTSIVYLRYILLAIMARKNTDEKTFGELFFSYSDEVRNITFFEALELLLTLLKNYLKDKLMLKETEVQELIAEFIDSLPPIIAFYIPGNMCES
jgi:hypothetical protein